MSSPHVYNIPARLIDSYCGRSVILRSDIPGDISYSLSRSDSTTVRFIQLLSVPADTSDLEACGAGVPIEIVLKDPAAEFPRLYIYTNLIDTHPVRVAIPVLPGFSKAVKLAVSLNFAVKLDMGLPDALLIKELADVLDFYLHRPNVRQSIDFFQTTLLSFYRNEPVSLWEIAEEDPSQVRYITDDGLETISGRFVGAKLAGNLDDFVVRYGQELLFERRECHDCEFFDRCGGYFKWPDKSYDCAGIKRLFLTLRNAADELKRDLAGFREPLVGQLS